MIEVNLVPDVKLELLKAQKQQRLVVSGSILVAIASVAIVVMMSAYAFGVQTVAESFADGGIDSESKKLASVEGLSKSLTLQAQLDVLSDVEADKQITSRIFDILTVVVPSGANKVDISRLDVDTKEGTIEIEAQAANGYEAMEVFTKTLAQTTLNYSQEDGGEPTPIATEISLGDQSYGEDSNRNKVLRFSLSFTYAEDLFDSTLSNIRIVGPNQQRATDSTQGVPKELFSSGGAN